LSQDITLTALAQLGVHRLNARRALISLFDRKFQYVIAEATRSIALRPHSTYPPKDGDDLWLSGTAIPRSSGLCEHVLDIADPTAEHESATQTEHESAKQPDMDSLFVAPDLCEDDRFCNYYHVKGSPFNRFYAGAPIKTPGGLTVGVYCVFDDVPRPSGLEPGDVEVLTDLSRAIMHHLEANKLRSESRRNARMVRGIGSFVEGSSTLAGWWNDGKDTSFQGKSGDEGFLDSKQQELARTVPIDAETGREKPKPTAVTQKFPVSHTPAPKSSLVVNFKENTSQITKAGVSSPNPTGSSSDFAAKPPLDFQASEAQKIFARAANIIRESIEVEGVAIFDAQLSSFKIMVGDSKNDSSDSEASVRTSSSRGRDAAMDSTNVQQPGPTERFCKLLAFSTSDRSTINNQLNEHAFPILETFLKVLLQRYPAGKIFSFDETGTLQSSESEGSDIVTDVQRTMAGSKASGHPSGSSAVKGNRRRTKRHSRTNDAASVTQILPGARSVVFVPLWDAQRERWFAGAMAWTRQPSRRFSARGEMSYLSAFGATIMSQIGRLEVITTDKAKADLLGSISHELRSPLHGVLGSVEMLSDTNIDVFQREVLNTIETCGRTLLDTIDHLLDYAKINNFLQVNKQSRSQRYSIAHGLAAVGDDSVESGMTSLSADVEVDFLVEEVLESVYSGHNFTTRTTPGPDNAPTSPAAQSSLGHTPLETFESDFSWHTTTHLPSDSIFGSLPSDMPLSSDIAIVLDIQKLSESGTTYHCQPGALRRILMNLFGNSLKYTSHGQICVSISAQPDQTRAASSGGNSHAKARPSEVAFKIADTGRGISPDYLQNRIFTAFSQENRLAPGNGLGLSLVRQIVQGLDGTIEVHSQVGIGSEFTVKLPLLEGKSDASNTSPQASEFNEHLEIVKGSKLAMIGFWESDTENAFDERKLSDINEEHPEPITGTDFKWRLPRRDVESICEKRLGMEVMSSFQPFPTSTQTPSEDLPLPDLILATEEGAEQLVKDVLANHSRLRGSVHSTHMPPVIIVCRNAMIAKARSNTWVDDRLHLDWISQPYVFFSSRRFSQVHCYWPCFAFLLV
jgi:signal transduction histidine kinase